VWGIDLQFLQHFQAIFDTSLEAGYDFLLSNTDILQIHDYLPISVVMSGSRSRPDRFTSYWKRHR
jgi:hypothetical protein